MVELASPVIRTEPREHYVKQTWFFDVQASYNFAFVRRSKRKPCPVMPKIQSSSGNGTTERNCRGANSKFGLPCWKRLFNDTTVTLGCNNVFGHDPPTAAATANYADFLYDSTGRFVYVSLQKRF